MPHSSGGGSSSGGGHSGSSSSHSSSSGGSSGPRIRNSYFPNSRRFVYYRDNHPCYVYSDTNLRTQTQRKPSIFRYFLLLFYIPSLTLIIPMITSSLNNKVSPLDNYANNVSKIEDNINIIDDGEKQSLQAALDEFTETTGIAVTVCTDLNTTWMQDHSSLINYSYDAYLNRFTDEKHWLLVYTCDLNDVGEIGNWYWEGMQGNDTDNVLNVFLNDFNSKLQNRFSSSSYSVGTAFTSCFKEASISFANQSNSIDSRVLLTGIAAMAFICVHCYFMVFAGNTKPKYKNEELIEVPSGPTNPVTILCANCGGEYVATAHNNCPYCGAEVRVKSDVESTLFQ